MNSGTPPSPRAGGFLLAASILVGTAIGIALRQPTLGVLGGTALGLILALVLWLLDRRR